jgi:pimeloyl-ACP methyl ester carboxylesterase
MLSSELIVDNHQKEAPTRLLRKGSGKPLLFLHGLYGQEWSGFLDDLAASHDVIAPETPGTGNIDDLAAYDNIYDLLLFYDDLMRGLGIAHYDVVGHSFGGMVAAELAAAFPERIGHLVLIDALGLWLDDEPVGDWVATEPCALAAMLYANPTSQAVSEHNKPPEDLEEKMMAGLRKGQAIASASHFIWPIPDRGLSRRLYRLTMPTLIVWGKEDRFAPPAYADFFAEGISNARILIVDGAGHSPHIEAREKTAGAVSALLGA